MIPNQVGRHHQAVRTAGVNAVRRRDRRLQVSLPGGGMDGASNAGAEAPTLRRHHPGDDGGRRECYTANSTAGGFQVPSPGGRIDGASVFGQ
jgi:hypothetical protein